MAEVVSTVKLDDQGSILRTQLVKVEIGLPQTVL